MSSDAGRWKTLGVPVVIGGDNLSSPVRIGLTDLTNNGGPLHWPPWPPPRFRHHCISLSPPKCSTFRPLWNTIWVFSTVPQDITIVWFRIVRKIQWALDIDKEQTRVIQARYRNIFWKCQTFTKLNFMYTFYLHLRPG